MNNIEIIKELFIFINQKTKINRLNANELILKNQEIQSLVYKKYINDLSEGRGLNFDSINIQEVVNKNHSALEKIINLYSSNIYWSRNWSFYPFSKHYSSQLGQFLLFKGGEYRLVRPGEFIINKANKTGDLVDIKIKELELVTQSDGGKWLVVNGKNILGENSILRVYFNFNYSDFSSLCVLITRFTEELNNRFISFKLKIAPIDYQRSDTGVLYFHRSQMLVVFYVINKLFNPSEKLKRPARLNKFLAKINLISSKKMVESYFDPRKLLNYSTPLFTRPLIDGLGIGFAEEIDGSVFSYGQFVSKKIAAIFLKLNGNFDEKNIIKELEQMGTNVNEMFRNDFTNYPYDFSMFDENSDEFSFNNNINKFGTLKYALDFGRNILKNSLYFKNFNNETEIKWQTAKFDGKLDINYELIDDSFENGRLGIIYFLYKLYLKFPDELIFLKTVSIVLKNLKRNGDSEIDANCYDYLKSKLNSNSGPSFIYKIGIEDSKNFLYNYKKFQIVSNLKNNVFVPTIKDGYAGFGLKLLEDKQENLDNILEYFGSYSLD